MALFEKKSCGAFFGAFRQKNGASQFGMFKHTVCYSQEKEDSGSECLCRIRIDLKNNYNLYLKNIISVGEDLPMLLRKKEPIFLK